MLQTIGAMPSVPILLVGAMTGPGSALILSEGHGGNILSLGSAIHFINLVLSFMY